MRGAVGWNPLSKPASTMMADSVPNLEDSEREGSCPTGVAVRWMQSQSHECSEVGSPAP